MLSALKWETHVRHCWWFWPSQCMFTKLFFKSAAVFCLPVNTNCEGFQHGTNMCKAPWEKHGSSVQIRLSSKNHVVGVRKGSSLFCALFCLFVVAASRHTARPGAQCADTPRRNPTFIIYQAAKWCHENGSARREVGSRDVASLFASDTVWSRGCALPRAARAEAVRSTSGGWRAKYRLYQVELLISRWHPILYPSTSWIDHFIPR